MAYEQPIIIKKVKKHEHAHHGGAWKIAYADFVTAMMAFFLLLWLISMTTPEQKQGLADYFAPPNVSASTSGSGGVLGGTALDDSDVKKAGSSPLTKQEAPVPPGTTDQGAVSMSTGGKGEDAGDQVQEGRLARTALAAQRELRAGREREFRHVHHAMLAAADPFTERVQKGDTTFYRARFAGFDKSSAEAACRQLKRNDFACMALKD